MSPAEKMDRDELLLAAYEQVPFRAPLISSEADRRLFARAWITAQTGEQFDDPDDRSLVLAGYVAGIVEADSDPARAQLVADLAVATERVAAAKATRETLDGTILDAQRVAAEFTADVERAEEAERIAEAEATVATSTAAIRKASERIAKSARAVAEARTAARLAETKIAEARGRQAPAIAEADAAVRAAEAAVEGVRSAIRSIDVLHTWPLYQSAVRSEEEHHARVMAPLARTKACLDAEARKLGLELDPPIPEAPPVPEYAVSVVWPAPAHQDRRPRLATDADIAVLLRFGIQCVKYDAVLGNVNPGWSAAQVLGLSKPPPPQPRVEPAEKVYPTRLTDDAADRLAHYLATGGSHETIVGEGQIRGSDPTLFARVRPPSANELRSLAKLPRLSRDELPLGEADDGPAGWAHDGAILDRLELALKPGGALAMARGQKNVGRPKSLGGVVAGHAPVDLIAEEGRKYRRAQEGKSPAEPGRVVRLGADNKPDDVASPWGPR